MTEQNTVTLNRKFLCICLMDNIHESFDHFFCISVVLKDKCTVIGRKRLMHNAQKTREDIYFSTVNIKINKSIYTLEQI
jgi:hypothetical protein